MTHMEMEITITTVKETENVIGTEINAIVEETDVTVEEIDVAAEEDFSNFGKVNTGQDTILRCLVLFL